jgi:hypothetical protein
LSSLLGCVLGELIELRQTSLQLTLIKSGIYLRKMGFDKFEEIVARTLRQNSDTYSSPHQRDSDTHDIAQHQQDVRTQLSMMRRMSRSSVSWMGKKGGYRFSMYDRPGHIESRVEHLFDTFE